MKGKMRVGQLVVRPPIFYGWYMVLACGVVAFYSWGLGFYGLGVYLQALHTLHDWPTSLISAATTFYYLGSAAVGLIVGGIIDRRGATPVIAFGAIVMGLGIVALSFITVRWQLFAVYLLMSTSLASLSTTTIGGTLLPWFNKYRGRAMALALMGPSVGAWCWCPWMRTIVQRHYRLQCGKHSPRLCVPMYQKCLHETPFHLSCGKVLPERSKRRGHPVVLPSGSRDLAAMALEHRTLQPSGRSLLQSGDTCFPNPPYIFET